MSLLGWLDRNLAGTTYPEHSEILSHSSSLARVSVIATYSVLMQGFTLLIPHLDTFFFCFFGLDSRQPHKNSPPRCEFSKDFTGHCLPLSLPPSSSPFFFA